jgi:hypothetical protein
LFPSLFMAILYRRRYPIPFLPLNLFSSFFKKFFTT